MPERRITTIPARADLDITQLEAPISKRRVAAYARVSTDMAEQQTSYSVQVDYYTSYIKSRDDWEFVFVYTDEGISGTSLCHREGFKQMVQDAMEHKFDLLITKSVSRFARNTVDSLNTIRQLKEEGVEVWFEKENIWTFDSKGEFLITLMASLAQEESRSISENITWGIRKGFEEGRDVTNWRRMLGYTVDNAGDPVIDEEQAEIVREIFRLYLTGLSERAIANTLIKMGIKTSTGKLSWSQKNIRIILENEKYKGDSRLQKTYTTSYLTKKYKKNNGALPQYYVENSHPAIISPEIFDLAQSERERRKMEGTRYTAKGVFSSRIKCGMCGCWYGRKVWHSNKEYRKVIYQCNHKYLGRKIKDPNREKCTTPNLTEDEIKGLFIKAVNILIGQKNEISKSVEEIRQSLYSTVDLEQKQKAVYEEMTELSKSAADYAAQNAVNPSTQEDYVEKYNKMVEHYQEVKAQYEELAKEIQHRRAGDQLIINFKKTLLKQGVVTEFDENLWGALIDNVTAYTDDNIVFTFRDGTEVKVGK